MTETVAQILAAHRAGTMTPEETVARSYARIRAHGDPAIFITLRDEADALAEARNVVARGGYLPLYGIPVAIKDNIDVMGLPTTAACPAFSYQPARDATAVERLRLAGAIVIGKTNLDQFATGLVGVRSPYGVPRNALDPTLIPGGSSSGSAVAVAAGLVPLALGTDTAGSGRVPAMLNNIVGLKPSLDLIPTTGVVPACRSLDCVSVLALTTDDAEAALAILARTDPHIPHWQPPRYPLTPSIAFDIGVPFRYEREFFGDAQAAADYEAAIRRLEGLGAHIYSVDMEPFYEAARLLYEGPWVAERYIVVESLINASPQALHPVTREIIRGGAKPSAADAFKAFYRLEELRRIADETFRRVDMLALPTAPTVYTVEQVLADPVALNSRLGTYTNFVNLLGMCGLALPAALHGARPFGITLLSSAGRDGQLAHVGGIFHADTGLPLGALGVPQPPLTAIGPPLSDGLLALAVVGAHLSGMPLNHELKTLGAQLLESTATAPDYRLFALAGGETRKPGLLRVAQGQGRAIELEVWALPAESFGRFVAAVPPPLSIGSLNLADGRVVKGFLVEAEAVDGARDISSYGGWRAFVAAE